MMESATIIPVWLEQELQGSYLDYAMSVIVSRALPDVRDGLKPVHRRILYAMLQEGLTPDKKHSKCAGVVGEVLKKFHPHGDDAVYDALVRLAQSWSLRYPMIDGQGNFGSIDGDPPAAYRYTECRMEKIAEEMLSDIEKETVDFSPNFDETTDEPVVLPTRVPNLLINGSDGIAVGMTAKIPPHNLGEVIEATCILLENPHATLEELMEVLPGPDFPTGGTIIGKTGIKKAYLTGQGSFKIRAKTHIETITTETRKVEAIIVDEIPYQKQKAAMVESIAHLVRDKKVEGISKIRDESDRTGMRIVFELKRDANPEVVLNQLYQHSSLQESYSIMLRAIVNKRPRILGVSDVLRCFIDHRREVVARRSQFELAKAKARNHIVEGLLKALDVIDKIIETIRNSDTTAEARAALMANFGFSEIQANHILDMPLKKLTGLERKSLQEENIALLLDITRLEALLADTKAIDGVVKEELQEIKAKFQDKRRTNIEEDMGEILDEDLIEEEPMLVTISHKGYIKRCQIDTYKAQRRGGKGIQGTKKLDGGVEEDFVTEMFSASTHASLLIFTSNGKVFSKRVFELPEVERTARGKAIINLVPLDDGERVTTVLPIRHLTEPGAVVLVTKQGYIKRVDLSDFSDVRSSGLELQY